MNREQILEVLKVMAKGQGFYSRLLKGLTEEELNSLVAKGFKEPIDLVMYLEG